MAGITGIIGKFYGSNKDLYGSKPTVPEFPDYVEAVKKAVSGNISLVPSLTELSTKSTELYKKLMETALPGIGDVNAKGLEQIKSMVSGEIPKDTIRLLKQLSAESGAATGTSGSTFNANQTLRNLGLTSLDVIGRGLSAAERWSAQAQGRTFDFSRMFLGPQDAIRQAEGKWGRDWLASQVQAAPDPARRGAYDSEMALLGMVLSAYGGGAGYTQGYRPSYGGGGGYEGQGAGYNFDRSYQSYFGAGSNNFYYGNSNPSEGVFSGQNYHVDNMQDFSGYA